MGHSIDHMMREKLEKIPQLAKSFRAHRAKVKDTED
jgi:hypothetical protein